MTIKSPIAVKPVLWLLLPVLLCGQSLSAQSYIADIQKISVEDGLSSRFVNTIYKDSRGFMWIATQYGLNRYDGYSFKLYTVENGVLTSNNIRQIHEDSDQKLWLIYYDVLDLRQLKNIDILDMQTGSVQSFEETFKETAPFTADDIEQVYSDTEKNIWISTSKGTIYHYRLNRFEPVFSAPEQEFLKILHIDDQSLWLHGKELLKVNTKHKKTKRFRLREGTRIVGIDSDNNLWFFQPEQKTMLQISNEKETLKTVHLQLLGLPEEIYESTDSRNFHINPADNLIWWYQENLSEYLFVFHPREGMIFNLEHKIKPLQTYEDPTVTDMYFDSENRVWVATNDGVFVISLKKNKFTTLLSGKSQSYSTRGITEDNHGKIYINTYSGRMIIDPEKEEIKKDQENTIWLGATKDKSGNLWFGEQEPMIEKYDPLSGQSQYYVYPDDMTDEPILQWTIIRDKTGYIWTGTHQGLYELEPETGRYRKFSRYNTFSLLGKSSIYYLYEDEKGIWITASSGLYLLEPGKGITKRHASGESAPYHIPYDHLLHFYSDKAGIFWLATKGGGLIRFNPEDGSYRQFTTTEGLSNNIIYAVYEDAYGKLWLPSDYGLMQFDKKTHQVNTYLEGDGIAHDEFNLTSHYQAVDGRLYFGGLSGVTVFDPKDFTGEDRRPAPLQITGCRVLNGKTGALTDRTVALSSLGELVLSPSDKSFVIEFALLNYENTGQNSYAYKIEGLDKDWTTIRENSLRINALPYGSYVLKIKGQGIKGQWSANELAIPVIVNKPFYLENEFILACLVALGLLIYGIFRWRLQNLKQAKVKLQETVRQRTQEIQRQKDKIEQDKNTIELQAEKLRELNITQSRWFINIAHELRTPLTLILGPIRQFLKKHPDKPEKDTEDIQLAEKNSMSLLKLVNEILDVSRLESNSLEITKKPANLTQLIRESVAHFESFARQKGVTLTTRIPDNIDITIDKNRIQKILTNLISNALKFTHAGGKVTVSLRNEDKDGVKISVTDTGEGIPEKDLPHIFERYYQASRPGQINQGGTGIGLALSLELARLHEGNLSVKSQINKGSVFTLSLPGNLVINVKRSTSLQPLNTHPALSKIIAGPLDKTVIRQKDKAMILLVEDNPDMRQYILGFMAERYEVIEAADGLEALAFLKKTTPDLIISDIMMPRMDGITLAKTLKDDEHLKNIPFITLTARAAESDKIAALRTGIDDYLTKPFNAEELEARAANLIRNYRERRAVSETEPDEITAPAYQDQLVIDMKAVVTDQLENNAFTIHDLAGSQNMSLSSLRRFLKKTTGLSPGQFIREIRLQKARRLLEAKQYPTVLEVVYAVGFEHPSHFARLFSDRFGKKPSEYL